MITVSILWLIVWLFLAVWFGAFVGIVVLSLFRNYGD